MIGKPEWCRSSRRPISLPRSSRAHRSSDEHRPRYRVLVPCARATDDLEITVVITTRNRLALLKEAVASVHGQDHPHWRLVVVDDASEDGTWPWLQSFSGERTSVTRTDRHSERSVARNLGIDRAPSPSVLLLDDDDRLRPDALRRLATTLNAYPDAVASVGGLKYFDDFGNTKARPHPRRQMAKDIWSDVVWGWVAHTGRTLLRTDVVKRAGGFRPGLVAGEDRDLWLRLSRLGPVAFSPHVVLDHRLHAAQWRPVGVRQLEAEITRRHMATLPDRDRRMAERIARGRDIYEDVREAWWAEHPRQTARLLAKLAVLHPQLMYRYLVRPSRLRSFFRIGAGVVFDAKGTEFVRKVERWTGRSEWRPTFPQERQSDSL